MFAGFQLKCPCLAMVVVVDNVTWSVKGPLYVGFCHVHLSPVGDVSLHCALSTEGYATVLRSALRNCVELRSCLRECKSLFTWGKMYTFRRISVLLKKQLPLAEISKSSRSPDGTLCFLSSFCCSVRRSMRQTAPDPSLWRSWRSNWGNKKEKKVLTILLQSRV